MASDLKKTSNDDSVQIVLIGATGSGKSSSGNTILGKKHFLSKTSAKSVTLECRSATEMINGRQVTVVDTPGWGCTELSEHNVMTEIQQTLQNLHGPYSFLLVLQVRSLGSEEKIFYGLKKVFGPSYLEHTTILFSHSDDLEFQTFDEFIQGGEMFQTLLRECGGRHHYWNNRNERCDEDVENLLKHLKDTECSVESSKDKMRTIMVETLLEQKDRKLTCDKRLTEEDTIAMGSQPSKKPIQVVFLGMTKMGKTSSIRTLKEQGEQTEHKHVYRYRSAGLSLHLMDTSGFDENAEEIQKILSIVSKTEPHVIVIVMSVDRFSPGTKRTMRDVLRSLGKNATKHTIILFTGKDLLQGKSIEDFIEQNADLQKLVNKNGNRFHALNNRDTSNQRQVDELLQKIINLYKTNMGEFYKPEERHFDPNYKKGQPKRWGKPFRNLSINI